MYFNCTFVPYNRNYLYIISIIEKDSFEHESNYFCYIWNDIHISFFKAFVNIFPQYTSYLESSWFLDSYKLAPVVLSIVYLVFFVIGEMILKNSELTESEEYIRILFFCYLIFTIITMQTSLLSRFAHYFSPFAALYVPMFLHKVSDRRIKWALLYLIIIVYSIFLFVIVYYKADWYNVVPYRSVIVDWLVGKEI